MGWLDKYTAQQDATRVVVPLSKKVNQEEKEYYNPPVEKDITSGDWKQDLLYNNQWLFNTPIVKDKLKSLAKKVATNSGGSYVIEDLKTTNGSNSDYDYGKSGTNSNLVNQYFESKPILPKSKYSPKSDYLSFLPSYSVKNNFDDIKHRDVSFFIDDIINNVELYNPDKSFKYSDFINDKKTRYVAFPGSSSMSQSLDVDLGRHKGGLAWDKSIDLPYVSVSDAWDFEPENYSERWKTKENKDKLKEFYQKGKIQSTLLHKSGHPFKIYDRFYFDPKTQEYIPDDSIQSLKRSKGITPLEDEAMNKDISKWFPEKRNGGKLTNFTKPAANNWLSKYE